MPPFEFGGQLGRSSLTRRSFAASFGALLLDAGFSFPAQAASLPDVLRSAIAGTTTPALGALIIRNGKVDEIAAVGLRRLGRPEQVQIGDAWLIGSCGKPMTTAMIARLVDRGVLSWTTPLSMMLPDLAQTMRPEYRSVTLVQLLSHRAGLPRGDELVDDRTFSDPRPLPQQRVDFLALALKEPPVAVPGTVAHYSNAGFIAAGAIAERVTGVPHEDLMRREVFQPLGMSSVVFSQPTEGELSGHRDGRARPSLRRAVQACITLRVSSVLPCRIGRGSASTSWRAPRERGGCCRPPLITSCKPRCRAARTR